MESPNPAVDNIWEGDLLDRKIEADLLIAYIESVSQQPNFREDASAFTIAVDAGYGEGKTYFLKRLAKQLAINHPVAFVDAWRDDLADEPLIALAATLKKALAPYIENKPAINAKFQTVLEKTGDVAKIVAKGLAKRGLGLLITNAAVNAADAIIEGSSEAIKDAVNDGLKDGSQEIVDAVAVGLERTSPGQMMEMRIADFAAGQRAIDELKASLSTLVKSLDEAGTHPPIVIVIDELDRCKPTYAVKLLEEVKHLFDVAGLVFVFGLHSTQLSHSIGATYGSSFDSNAYLSRFIGRWYSLEMKTQARLVEHGFQLLNIDTTRFFFPSIQTKHGSGQPPPSAILAAYLQLYGVAPRDTLRVLETLQTCLALTGTMGLFMPLLLPLLIAAVKKGESAKPQNLPLDVDRLNYWMKSYYAEKWQEYYFEAAYETALNLIDMSRRDFEKTINTSENDPVISRIAELAFDNRVAQYPLANPRKYRALVEAIGRFR